MRYGANVLVAVELPAKALTREYPHDCAQRSGRVQVVELKKLEVALAEARSEASKAEEDLDELAALRAFLDGLTPAHHFQVPVH
jgi:hypothetical protein